ncbi:ABC transporter ATP-binding protein [Umezakia ovalisporum]|uniref:ABC transporter ATP-binding protein n=1 Tax=Umezakia ovalisporum FSS-43 TaxID=2740520 RepID=A0ABT6K6W6_9CYAN|nr:ABC transporter ATP-binding protein [Umezakia ovalisporum]MDH6058061.1 ABC transporter ATP-binding protein [Umezakia ovalisporum FSS-43]MDH6066699.1 ABC transporter ATP-binding protein [Umezakia ovalisporum APH033B]MDH6071550.1 ABC transporter ATP-binding protein [Umezakia ovalisporum CobakiLakeA]MDH6073507.1 ABC transporter ATP-binding protein [Umezakia ovalisporum CS-1034]MDH6080890.1 ABC transporter ATP-binding protein [Umezakia ovalisporum FSS-44]
MISTHQDENFHSNQDDKEVLVRVENVSKKFCRGLKKSLWYGVQDIASELIGLKYEHELRPDEFWSVNDVSFELRRGECLGLIGPNGAGKSTLLKMLNGLIKPDKGRIEMNGRVGALIELGTGFNPILTGRENIYNNAAVLGLTKGEVDEKLDSIIEFAGVDEFLDMPVQSYSSGMKVRLGFAVAAHLKPDVLIIDEVLAVGDVGFRNKCYSAIDKIISDAAVILVSHNMEAITRIANRGLVLRSGTVVFDGLPVKAASEYSNLFEQKTENLVKPGFEFISLILTTDRGNSMIKYSEECTLAINIYAPDYYKNLLLKLNITTSSGLIAAEFSNRNNDYLVDLKKGVNTIYVTLDNICLLPQKYYISFSLIKNKSDHLFWCRNVAELLVEGHQQGHQPYQLKARAFDIIHQN